MHSCTLKPHSSQSLVRCTHTGSLWLHVKAAHKGCLWLSSGSCCVQGFFPTQHTTTLINLLAVEPAWLGIFLTCSHTWFPLRGDERGETLTKVHVLHTKNLRVSIVNSNRLKQGGCRFGCRKGRHPLKMTGRIYQSLSLAGVTKSLMISNPTCEVMVYGLWCLKIWGKTLLSVKEVSKRGLNQLT